MHFISGTLFLLLLSINSTFKLVGISPEVGEPQDRIPLSPSMEMSPDYFHPSLFEPLEGKMEKSAYLKNRSTPFLKSLENLLPVSTLCLLLTLLHGRAKIQNRCHSRHVFPH